MAESKALDLLLEGNARFVEGRTTVEPMSREDRESLANTQTPNAAVIACADSRVAPELIFDQPLGSIFCSRVPGNVASDSAKWMIDIAVGEFNVPLLLVLGHTGCLAIQQVLEGKEGSGGLLRYQVQSAVNEAKRGGPIDLLNRAIEQNARDTVKNLLTESHHLRNAVREDRILVKAGIYDMRSGVVRLVD
ncbi:MAG TPA: carbonic anhydrase [Fimbriimonadaceae bacterium]|nr:carbonic anhydrase [Fimbriimonadaceae bacterium]